MSDLFQAGEVLVTVKIGAGAVQELGLAEGPVSWNPVFRKLDVIVNAFGQGPWDLQQMALEASISFGLVYFTPAVLDACIAASLANAGGTVGQNARAGARMGNNVAAGAAGSNFISLGLSSPVAGKPFTFPTAFLSDQPFTWPLGAERSVVQCNWRAISYAATPYTLAGAVCWNNQLQS